LTNIFTASEVNSLQVNEDQRSIHVADKGHQECDLLAREAEQPVFPRAGPTCREAYPPNSLSLIYYVFAGVATPAAGAVLSSPRPSYPFPQPSTHTHLSPNDSRSPQEAERDQQSLDPRSAGQDRSHGFLRAQGPVSLTCISKQVFSFSFSWLSG
jgi:hypothetical protein